HGLRRGGVAGGFGGSRAAAFPRVIGYIPARALELNRGRRELALGFAAALGTLLRRRGRVAFDLLEAVTALDALVFVQRQAKLPSRQLRLRLQFQNQAYATRRSTGI